MVHGWPAIWSSWKHQILEFKVPRSSTQILGLANLGKDEYHVIAVDVRGFGLSTHPGGMKSSATFGDLVGDLKCILQHAGVHEEENVVCLGWALLISL
jgi:soluble epoxide hydrolase / lipid-phosphate phosphatase